MPRRFPYIIAVCTAILFIGAVFVWSLVYAATPAGLLTVAFLDVGQGDAIYIESPTGVQVLIDAGKGRAVLRGLGELMSAADRSLDAVIATHPDLDHIGGLPEVFDRYEINMFFESGVIDDGSDSVALQDAVAKESLTPIRARAGMKLAIGGNAFIEFLFPESDVSGFESNTGSIVARVVYGSTAFMLTGDAPVSIENHLAGRYGNHLHADVLKVGHHGSKTSTGGIFLGAISPAYAVISAGCDNTYGHPHAEVMERLRRFEAEILETCSEGTIRFVSDGISVTRK